MSSFHELGCSIAFECVEKAPRARHTIKAVPRGSRTAVIVNGRYACETDDREVAYMILAGFRVGMAYFGKKARRLI